MGMFNDLTVWAVTSLRTDVTAVSNRVTSDGTSYVNTTIPRLSVGRVIGATENSAFIGNVQGYPSGNKKGSVFDLTLPIHVFSRSQDKDQIVDAVIKSMLTTRRTTSSGNKVLDIKMAGINFLNESNDDKKPEVFHAIIDFKVMFDREE